MGAAGATKDQHREKDDERDWEESKKRQKPN